MDAEATKSDGEQMKETAARLFADWMGMAKAAVEEAEKFAKEKPVTAAAGAFVLGWLAGSLFKR